MDAVTLVAAAVAIAVDQARNAALEDALLQRERAAMRAEDSDSLIAQRYFVRSAQLPASAQLPTPQGRPQTWQAAYNELEADYEQALDALREVRIANNDGDAERIEEVVGRELGHSSSEEAASSDAEGSEAESSSDEEPPPAPQPVQRCARCASTRNLELLLPTGRWANVPMDQRLFCDACIDAAE